MNDVPKANEFEKAPHLLYLKHRSPAIRKATAKLAGHHTRVAQFEVEILTVYLKYEFEKWEDIRGGFLDDDIKPIEAVLDELCGALGRVAQYGGDIAMAVPLLLPLVYQEKGNLCRLSAAWALREYHRQLQGRGKAA